MRAAAASGSVEHARHLFDEMLQQGLASTVVTLGTLVAALYDRGQLEEAFEVKEMMARRYNVKPNAHVYASLMKGLCERGKVDAAVRLKEEMARNAELGLDSPVYATLAIGVQTSSKGFCSDPHRRVPYASRVFHWRAIPGVSGASQGAS